MKETSLQMVDTMAAVAVAKERRLALKVNIMNLDMVAVEQQILEP